MWLDLPEEVKQGRVVEGPALFVFSLKHESFGHIIDVWPEKGLILALKDDYGPEENALMEGRFDEFMALARA